MTPEELSKRVHLALGASLDGDVTIDEDGVHFLTENHYISISEDMAVEVKLRDDVAQAIGGDVVRRLLDKRLKTYL